MILACECTAPKRSLLRFPPQSFHFTVAHPTPLLILHTDAHPSSASVFVWQFKHTLSMSFSLLWHNVVCNRWPPTTHTLTVCSLCICDVIWECFEAVFGVWGGRAAGHCIFFFTPPSVSVRLSDSSKSPCSFFTPYPRSGQYERSPGERRTKGHTCDTLRPFGSGSG